MMRRRRSRRWAAVAGVVGAFVLAVFVYLWLDTRKADEPAAPDETTQTPVVEPPAPENLESPAAVIHAPLSSFPLPLRHRCPKLKG